MRGGRRAAGRPEDEPELTLFGSFDGLDDLQRIDFYEHVAGTGRAAGVQSAVRVVVRAGCTGGAGGVAGAKAKVCGPSAE